MSIHRDSLFLTAENRRSELIKDAIISMMPGKVGGEWEKNGERGKREDRSKSAPQRKVAMLMNIQTVVNQWLPLFLDDAILEETMRTRVPAAINNSSIE
jgi:hypothetical protein